MWEKSRWTTYQASRLDGEQFLQRYRIYKNYWLMMGGMVVWRRETERPRKAAETGGAGGSSISFDDSDIV